MVEIADGRVIPVHYNPDNPDHQKPANRFQKQQKQAGQPKKQRQQPGDRPQPGQQTPVITTDNIRPVNPDKPDGWHTVSESSAIQLLRDDRQRRELIAQYRNSNGFYVYSDVSPELAQQIAAAQKIGTEINKKLRHAAREWGPADCTVLLEEPKIRPDRVQRFLTRVSKKRLTDKALSDYIAKTLIVKKKDWSPG